jgi:hypothetical protein
LPLQSTVAIPDYLNTAAGKTDLGRQPQQLP